MFRIIDHELGKHIYRTERTKAIDSIIIHHTWDYSIKSCVEHWERTGYGSHFIIDRDGTIYCMVCPHYKVNHCVSMNDNSIGVDLMRGKGEAILDCQYTSLNTLIEYLVSVYNIECKLHEKGLFYHCDIRKTQCPKPIEDSKIYGYTGNNNNH